MRKVTRKSLDELAKVMPIISEERQKMYIGGTSGCSDRYRLSRLPDL